MLLYASPTDNSLRTNKTAGGWLAGTFCICRWDMPESKLFLVRLFIIFIFILKRPIGDEKIRVIKERSGGHLPRPLSF
jgi:hypothetical protein